MKAALYSADSSLAQLTIVYNGIVGVKPIKKFTCSKAEAIARIEAAFKAVPKAKTGLTITAVYSGKGVCVAGPRTGVCAWMREQHKAGKTAKETFSELHSHFPAAKTELKTVHWYFNKLGKI